MAHELPFNPFPLLGSPHSQTIVSSLLGAWSPEPPSMQKLIALPDGDQLSLEMTTPEKWLPTDPTVVLLHGLCGSHRSSYLVRMAKRLKSMGIRAVRVNMRGCGSGRGLAKHFYHSGRSEDVLEVLKVLKNEHNKSQVTLVGYSLGANIALKLSGELKGDGPALLHQVIAVSPPADLHLCVQMFDKPENAIYERHFFKALRAHVRDLLKENAPALPNNLKVIEFDDLMTAPRSGFASALDYYAKCSSASFVPHIRLPCKILFAEDDPFISHSTLDELAIPTNVQIFKTKKGGHLGYLGSPLHKKGVRWLDSLLIEWITGT